MKKILSILAVLLFVFVSTSTFAQEKTYQITNMEKYDKYGTKEELSNNEKSKIGDRMYVSEFDEIVKLRKDNSTKVYILDKVSSTINSVTYKSTKVGTYSIYEGTLVITKYPFENEIVMTTIELYKNNKKFRGKFITKLKEL